MQDETVFVVDFKTNRAIPGNPEQIPVGILNQMVIYEHAIKQLYPKYVIKTGILWTAEAKFMEIHSASCRMRKLTLQILTFERGLHTS